MTKCLAIQSSSTYLEWLADPRKLTGDAIGVLYWCMADLGLSVKAVK